MNLPNADQTLTVTFEGVDLKGEHFTFARTLDVRRAKPSGDNPRYYGMQLADALSRAGSALRTAVEATYGSPDA